jgi:hypothetical protein
MEIVVDSSDVKLVQNKNKEDSNSSVLFEAVLNNDDKQ